MSTAARNHDPESKDQYALPKLYVRLTLTLKVIVGNFAPEEMHVERLNYGGNPSECVVGTREVSSAFTFQPKPMPDG